MSASRPVSASLTMALGALMAIAPLATDLYLPGLPALAGDLGSGMGAAQATVTVSLFGMGIGQLFFGPLSDAVGRRWPAILATAGHGLLSVLCALVQNIELLLVLRLVQGFCGAAAMVVVMAVVRDISAGRAAGVLMSRLMLVMGVAPVLGPTLGGALLLLTDWRGIFIALAALAAVISAFAYWRLPESLEHERRNDFRFGPVLRSYAAVLRDRIFVAVLIAAAATSTGMFAFISASPFIYQEVYGVGEQAYAALFGMNALCMVVGTQINPLLLRRWAPPKILLLAVVWMTLWATVAIIGVITTDNMWLFAIPMAVFQFGLGLVNPNTQVIGLHAHGARAGAAAAVLGAGRFMVAGLLAPMVGRFGGDSAVPLCVVMAAVSLLSVAVVLVVRRAMASVDYS